MEFLPLRLFVWRGFREGSEARAFAPSSGVFFGSLSLFFVSRFKSTALRSALTNVLSLGMGCVVLSLLDYSTILGMFLLFAIEPFEFESSLSVDSW